jgi:ribosomal protein S18 acetylase RimI-like enzyme
LRGQGFGSRLLAWAEDKARSDGCAACALSVALDNQRARALYERQGYRSVGLYRFGDDGFYRMVKGLDGS